MRRDKEDRRMKIEDVTTESLAKVENGELNSLRDRMNQIYVRHLKDPGQVFWQGITKDGLIKKYALFYKEADKREIKYKVIRPLDKLVSPAMILKRKLWGIELDDVKDVLLTSGYVSIIGKFVESPAGAEKIEVALFNEDFEGKVQKAITELVKKETGKDLDFSLPDMAKAADLTHIPLFDLVLKVRDEIKKVPGKTIIKSAENIKCAFCKADAKWIYKQEDGDKWLGVCHKHRMKARMRFEKEVTKAKVVSIKDFKPPVAWPDEELIEEIEKAEKIDISKPFENEHSARLQPPGNYDNFRRTKGGYLYGKSIKVPANVSIIWGHPKGKPPKIWVPQALRFPKDAYTVAAAKKWLSDNEVKSTGFEAAKTKAVILFKIDKIEPEYIVGGVVYEADTEDTQGDQASASEIWKAMKKYMIEKRKVKVMHKGKARDLPIVECYFSEDDHKKGTGVLKKGTWWMSVSLEKEKDIWKEIEDGTLTGFSMGGTSMEEKVDE